MRPQVRVVHARGWTKPEPPGCSVDSGWLGVFDVFRSYNSQFVTLEVHYRRLERSCAALEISGLAALEEIRAELCGTGITPDVRVRITVASSIALGAYGTWIELEPLEVQSEWSSGIALAIVRAERVTRSGHKMASFGAHRTALSSARALGAAEALIRDHDDAIREGATSNIFVVKGDQVITPDGDGIFPGFMRRRVLRWLSRESVPVEFRPLYSEDFGEHDFGEHTEAFITSSVRGVVPVRAMADRTFETGPMTLGHRLRADIESSLESGVDRFLPDGK